MATNIERISKGNNPVNAIISFVQNNRRKIIRPLVALAVILVIWQILCHDPNSTLPGPIKTISESGNLIINPFFDNGGTDKGLFWQLLASLQRVAIGFTLAAILGISLGILIGTNSLMFDALDPIFQVLRTIPPLAWLPISLGAFQQFNPFEGMGITTSEVSALFVILITAIWPIIINTTVGVCNKYPKTTETSPACLRLPRPKILLENPITLFGSLHLHWLENWYRFVLAGDRSCGNVSRRRGHRLLHLGRLQQF